MNNHTELCQKLRLTMICHAPLGRRSQHIERWPALGCQEKEEWCCHPRSSSWMQFLHVQYHSSSCLLLILTGRHSTFSEFASLNVSKVFFWKQAVSNHCFTSIQAIAMQLMHESSARHESQSHGNGYQPFQHWKDPMEWDMAPPLATFQLHV